MLDMRTFEDDAVLFAPLTHLNKKALVEMKNVHLLAKHPFERQTISAAADKALA